MDPKRALETATPVRSASILFLNLMFPTVKAVSISYRLQKHYFMHFAAGWAVAPMLERRCVVVC